MADPHTTAGERLYAVGDIHGCFELFSELIRAIRDDNARRAPARVRIVLLGDLIDRGPEPVRVVESCMALAEANPDFVVLRGNHEDAMLRALGGNLEVLGFWLDFGGDVTLRDWGVPDDLLNGNNLPALLASARAHVPERVLAWSRTLRLTWRSGDYLFVHAGIRPGRHLRFQAAADLMWIRDGFLNSEAAHRWTVVHGHTICEAAPEVRPNRIGIDAGAYETGRLIALGLEGGERWVLDAGRRDERSANAHVRGSATVQ